MDSCLPLGSISPNLVGGPNPCGYNRVADPPQDPDYCAALPGRLVARLKPRKAGSRDALRINRCDTMDQVNVGVKDQLSGDVVGDSLPVVLALQWPCV